MTLNRGRERTAGTPRRLRELRRFGLVMAVPLSLLAAALLWRQRPSWPYLLALAAAFALAGLVAPRLLSPVEKAWMALADWLSVVMSYVILTLAFILVVTPLGLVRRVFRRDPLHLRFDKASPSYWVEVEPDGPASRADRPY